jgi:pimeloyl-ACP methyl ester carboxylesterase
VLVGVVGAGHDDHDGVGQQPCDLARRLETSGARHRPVDDDRIGSQRFRELDRLRTVTGVADDPHVVRGLEKRTQRAAESRVVVDEQNRRHTESQAEAADVPENALPVDARERRIPKLTLVERELDVPLDHADPAGETITLFTREVIGDAPGAHELPLLVYFQGGPGHEAARPLAEPAKLSWLGRALRDYRVLLLDQRGTGRSTPVGTLPGLDPEAQAAYLTHLRADSIVRDAELVRQQLDVGRWSIMGQSFGGFCVLTYLSFFPDALREAFVCGGLAPIGRPTDDVYARTYPRVLDRCRRYYERYPDDRDRVRRIHELIGDGEIVLPTGEQLTSRRFQQLGLMLGMSDGAERLHSILELPPGSPGFLHDVAGAPGFARNPLFAAVHEACYADGCVTAWSAERLLPPELEDLDLFTGEHVYSWMFEDYAALRPLREAAELLAQHEWPRLYDEQQLAANEVPVAAVIYANDMYVDRELSEETAGRVRNLRPWLTNEYEHNGIRDDGARILDRLISLVN